MVVQMRAAGWPMCNFSGQRRVFRVVLHMAVYAAIYMPHCIGWSKSGAAEKVRAAWHYDAALDQVASDS